MWDLDIFLNGKVLGMIPGVGGGCVGGGDFTMLGPGKKLAPNGSYKQMLKWGSMGEISRQGQGVKPSHAPA